MLKAFATSETKYVIERYYEMQLEKARLESARAKAQEKLERYDKKHRKTAVWGRTYFEAG
ncbi:MAG: hypothetical protein IJB43_05065 [Clostridia bacterium]|nr:hypothetical protein [Clostridia bacterium]